MFSRYGHMISKCYLFICIEVLRYSQQGCIHTALSSKETGNRKEIQGCIHAALSSKETGSRKEIQGCIHAELSSKETGNGKEIQGCIHAELSSKETGNRKEIQGCIHAELSLHIDTSPGSSTKIKFLPVVTWKFELLKPLIISPVFTDHEASNQMKA